MPILNHVHNDIGWITLNRPQALNALSLSMVRELIDLLKEWEATPAVKMVVIQGAGEKAFCAGGDVRSVYEAKTRGDLTRAKSSSAKNTRSTPRFTSTQNPT